MGDAKNEDLRVRFDRRLKLIFLGSKAIPERFFKRLLL